MIRRLRSFASYRSEQKRRRTPAHKYAAGRALVRALGLERLEGRTLLTAGTLTWTGAVDANWSTPGNWDLDRAPMPGDSLTFPTGAQHLANNDDLPGLSVNSITFHGQGYLAASGYILSGDDLTVGTGGIVDDSHPIVAIVYNAASSPMPGAKPSGDSNQIDFNVTLSAAQSWENDDTAADHDLIINGNVDNGGFGLTATGPGIIEVTGQIGGSGGLNVVANATGGTPILELQGANAYTGGTWVGNGALIVNGSTSDASAVTVAGGRLGGTGAIGGQIAVWSAGGPGPTNTVPAGTLDPGAGPVPFLEIGTLSNTGGVSFEGNPLVAPNAPAGSGLAQFGVELGGAAASPTNDRLDSAGAVSLLDARLVLSTLGDAGPFNPGQQFVIVQAGAPITTTFAGLPEGSTVSDYAQNFTISYANDRVTLTALPVAVATITWTGHSAASGNWSDPANWDLGRAPTDGDSLVFPASAQRLANNDDLPGLSVNSITFQGTFTAGGGYALSGDDLTVGAGGIVDQSVVIPPPGASPTIANQIDLNLALGAAQSWQIGDSYPGHRLSFNGNVANNGFALLAAGTGAMDIAGEISGSGSLSASGGVVAEPLTAGPQIAFGGGGGLTLDLDHVNTYTGGTQVDDATVSVSADGALGPGGTNDAGATVGANGTLLFNAVAYNTPEAITLSGGNLQGAGNASFAGPITVSGVHSESLGLGLDGEISQAGPQGTFTLNGPTLTNNNHANLLIEGGGPEPLVSDTATLPTAGSQVTIDNVIDGAGGLMLANVNLLLGAANAYQGPTDLDGAAFLEVGVNNAIPSTSAVVMSSSVNQFNAIQLDGHSDTIGSLAGSQAGGGNAVDLGAGGSLTTGGDNASTSFDGNIRGSGTLTKAGSGTFDLTATNSFTGTTYVNAGTLLVDGSTAAGNDLSVGRATLGGSGTIGGTVMLAGGAVSPGAGPDPSLDTGTLTITGDAKLSGFYPPAPLQIAASEAAFAVQLGGTAAAPANDQLRSAASVSLVGVNLHLATLAGAGPFNPGQQFVIVQAGAPITTTFDRLPEGSAVSDGAQNFTISYANNRVTLTAQPLAEAAYLNGQAGDGTAATFVHNLYRELLGREPDAAGQASWINLFFQADTGGTNAAAAQQRVVAGFLGSTEYREHLIEGVYQSFLRRAADASGLAFWTSELAAGVDEKTVLAAILGSDEYVAEALGPGIHPANTVSDAQAWAGALYRDLLGRTADAAGLGFWTQQASTQDTPSGRAALAIEFLGAGEIDHKLLNGNYPGAAGSVGAPGTPAEGAYALADITGNGWDNLYFQGGLSAAAVDSLFADLQAGASFDATIAAMLDMPQYLNGAVAPT